CLHGCDAVEDMHHLFVHCRLYEEWRREATEEIIKKMVLKLENLDVEEVVQDGLLKAAKSLFLDDPSVMPQYPLEKSRRRSDWHTTTICLAGRIFGNYQ
ncbi:hypothetical protein L208DRAFT_1278980, partial [Tricholoma matsutake]